MITSYIDLNVDNENSNWKAQKDSHFVQTKCINLNWYISNKKTGWVFLKVVQTLHFKENQTTDNKN